MSRRRVRTSLGSRLSADDLVVLCECVQRCGRHDEDSFKMRLIGLLERGYDSGRCGRIIAAIKNRSEAEILAMCDAE